MRKGIAYFLIGTTVATLVGAGTLAANADWAIPAVCQIRIRTAAMPKGVKPSVAKQNKGAAVSWSALEVVPGVKIDSYTITAHSQDVPAKTALVRQVKANGSESQSITFAASELAGGKWKWTLIPHFASWTGAESGLSPALKFASAPAAQPADAPAPEALAPTTTRAPAARTTTKPADPPATTKPAAPVESLPKGTTTTPPPASSPAEQEPPVEESGPSASGSTPADIPQ